MWKQILIGKGQGQLDSELEVSFRALSNLINREGKPVLRMN